MTLLDVQDVQKYYGLRTALTKAVDHISFSVEEGEFVGIMGPSGSGKTTLLNCISTIDKVSAGKILVDGNDITRLKGNALNQLRRKQMGFIFQECNLLDTITAYDNIALALTINRESYPEIKRKIEELAALFEITDVMHYYPYQLSGGQKQKVAAARAIVTEPRLIMADEPTGALDSKSSRQLLEKLVLLNEEKKASILMVSHDAFAASYSDRILFIKDGKIYNEIRKGSDTRKQFFEKIIEIQTVLGGDQVHVI